MAEGTSAENNSWESWFGGWVQAAKEKSSTALEFVKKDLAEFSETIQKGTEQALEKTSSSLSRENTEQATTKVKAGISSFLGNISKVLVIPPSDDYVPVKVSADGSTLYDRGKARLHAIQLDASTYVDPPHGSQEQFEMWLNSFDMDQHKGDISEILVSKVEVRALYTKLVPNDVSHAEFWQRYFYRVHQLQCDEARKLALMQRADWTQGDSLGWDDDDWSCGEEDDDGNQSDWEKMPRPQPPRQPTDHSPKAEAEETLSKSHHSNPSPSSTHNSADESTLQDANISTKDKNNITQSDVQNVLQKNSDTTSCDKDSTSFSTKTDSGLETVHDHFSADISKAEASQEVSQVLATEADPHLPNLSVSVDTASASTPEEQVPPQENSLVPEPGSPAEMPGPGDVNDESRNPTSSNRHQSLGASSAAAASGVELCPPQDERNMITGDAACSAADVLSSPSPSLSTLLENDDAPVPDASSASKDSSNVPHDNSFPLVAENQDTNSKPVVEAENNETEDKEEGERTATQQPMEPITCNVNETVQSESDPDLAMRVKGDMVVVGETDTPSSDSSEPKGLGDDWEEDFDVELTEEDLKAAEDIARKLGENLDVDDDDWENWD